MSDSLHGFLLLVYFAKPTFSSGTVEGLRHTREFLFIQNDKKRAIKPLLAPLSLRGVGG